MNLFHLYQLIGAPPEGTAVGGSGGTLGMFIPLVLIIVIFYFFIIRPQNKKQKETQKMLSALKKGDKVVTIGGLHGTIDKVKESTVVIRVDDNARLEFSRSAISSVTSEGKAEKIEEKDGENAEESKN